MKKYDIVIFDLDGTLCDTAMDVHTSINETLSLMKLPNIDISQSRRAIGPGPMDFAHIVLGDHVERLPEFRKIFAPIYYENCTNETKPFDGIVNILEKLKPHTKLVVGTNKAERGALRTLKGTNLYKYFDAIVTRDMVKNPKPAPDMLYHICYNYTIPCERAIMIGDTDNDILSANAAGVAGCLALWGYSDHFESLKKIATHAINHPNELLSIIEN